jgi:hypothetical protein
MGRNGIMTDLGKVAYDSFVRECGYSKDARIIEFDKLRVDMKTRWRAVAADIIEAKEANDRLTRSARVKAKHVHRPKH